MPQRGGGGGERRKRGGLVCLSLMFNFYFIFFFPSLFSLSFFLPYFFKAGEGVVYALASARMTMQRATYLVEIATY